MIRTSHLLLTAAVFAGVVVPVSACSSDEQAPAGGSPAAGGGSGDASVSSGGNPGTGGQKATGGSATGGTTADAGKEASGPACGNGKVDTGEACDTGITVGRAGACPTSAACNDNDPCTRDVVVSDGTCSAKCDTSGKVAANPTTKDQCCPQGADSTMDADCSATCGNGTLDSGEDCDPAIASGTGACITQCGDGSDPCTKLVKADPCKPVCTPITAAANGDSCCPAGATTANDDDCTPTAFRMTQLVMYEPHPFFDDGTNCIDLVDAFNTIIIGPNVTGDTSGGPDGGANGIYDLSFVVVLRPGRQTGTSNAEFYQADCTFPSSPDAGSSGVSCSPSSAHPVQYFSYKNQSTGTCLAPDTQYMTTGYPAASPTTAGTNGCAVANEATLNLELSGVNLSFQHARLAGKWDAVPATGLTEGFFAGFLTEAYATQNTLPSSIPIVGGLPVATLFPTAANRTALCSAVDDSDTAPDGTTKGWWWYLNFEAKKVAWTGP